jgi:hypothetical protein
MAACGRTRSDRRGMIVGRTRDPARPQRPPHDDHRRALPAQRRDRPGPHPQGRHLPGPARTRGLDPVHRRQSGRLPADARHQPLAVHALHPAAGPDNAGREPRTARPADRRGRDDAADRRDNPPRDDPEADALAPGPCCPATRSAPSTSCSSTCAARPRAGRGHRLGRRRRHDDRRDLPARLPPGVDVTARVAPAATSTTSSAPRSRPEP